MNKSRLAGFTLALCALACGCPARAESYIGLLGGNYGTVSDGTVTITQTQFLCFAPPCSQTVANPVHFNREHTAGIRAGFWFDYVGVAAEYSTSGATSSTPLTSPSVTNAEVNYDMMAYLLMLRTPVLTGAYLPDSYLYAGLGASTIYARISATTRQLPPVSGDMHTNGILWLAGGALRFSRLMVFAEWRTQDLSFNYSFLGASANIPYNVTQKLVGVAYLF